MKDRTLGLPNLTARGRSTEVMVVQRTVTTKASRWKTFFAPIFSFFPFETGKRTFKLWPGGGQAVGPVNLSRSYGGITITPELSLQLSAVWGCVWRYANTISTLPLVLMRTGAGNSATPERKHPLYSILHDRPNIDMSAAKFWQAMIASMMTWGVAYAKKLMINGRLVALQPLRPEFMTVYQTREGRLRYRYYPSSGPGAMAGDGNQDFAADEIFVVIDRSMDGLTGLSRIQYAANSLGLAMAGDRTASLSYKNGLRASGILTIAQWLKPDQRAAYKQIVDGFVGTGTGDDTDKQFGVLVAENATKFEPINLKPIDMELLASRKYSVEDICRWYDMPPVLVGHSAEGQTMWGTGVEQIILGWLKLGLSPVLRVVEQEICRQLLTPEEQQNLFAEFNLDALLRGDSAARSTFYSQMAQNGIYTRNEIRARENLPPVDGGDIPTAQSNLLPLTKLGTMPADQATQVRTALRNFLGLEDGDANPAPERRDP